MKRFLCAAVVAGLGAVLVFLPAGMASAHEERVVGPFHLAVGFGEEPAYSGVENSVQLLLSDDRTGKPVADLGNTLKVRIEYGDKTMPAMLFEPNFEVGEFGTSGDYRAFFFPTRPGNYTFHLTGRIKGQKVDASFTSGPTTFSPVNDPGNVEFPAQDPSVGQLAEAIGRLGPRVDSAVARQGRLAEALAAQANRTHSAKTLALVALVVGAALGLGGLAMGTAGLRAARATRARSG
jgi:hypothetical protein